MNTWRESYRNSGRRGLDRLRTTRLVCADALPADEIDPEAIHLPEPRLRGLPAQLAFAAGWRGHRSLAVAPALAVRRAQLGDRASGPPRVLVRVDEFPHAHARDNADHVGTEAFGRFHEVLRTAGIPYLIAVMPRVARDYLDPQGGRGEELDAGEGAMLGRLVADGVSFGLHGHTHRTRDPRPRHHSALHGMSTIELERALDLAEAELRPYGIHPRVFVPPFNHFDPEHYAVLARRYAVICAGPESVRTMGLQMTPRWISEAVYLPSYPPLYGRAATAGAAVQALADEHAAVWAPVTLHFGWELDDDLQSLASFARTVAPYARPWQEFLAAVDASR
jgi:hypothetical protein